jgi:hypothetical protein
LLPHGAYPQEIILNKMNPQVAALPGAGPQEIVAQTTDPQVVVPHGADPQVISLNKMVSRLITSAGPQVIEFSKYEKNEQADPKMLTLMSGLLTPNISQRELTRLRSSLVNCNGSVLALELKN